MIDNSDKIGHYFVSIVATMATVNAFQCPTLEDARAEAKKIVDARKARGLPSRATAREITGKTGRQMILGPVIIL